MARRAQALKRTSKSVARATGRAAATVARATGRAAVRIAREAGRAAAHTRRKVKRAVVRRKIKRTLAATGDVLKTAGKAAAVAGLAAAAEITAMEIVRRRRRKF